MVKRDYAFPNMTPGRYRIPPDFKLIPDLEALAPGLLAVPESVTLPPVVVTGELITAVHQNMVREALADLWADVQYLDAAKPNAANVVPTTRQVIAGAGLTGGGALSADVTLSVSLTPAQKGAVQTPWLQNIDGAGFALTNTGNVGVGNSATLPHTDVGWVHLIVGRTTTTIPGEITVATNNPAVGGAAGVFSFANYNRAGAEKRIAQIVGTTETSADGGALGFSTATSAGAMTERVRIDNQGRVGIGTTAPDAPLAFAAVAGQKISLYQTGNNYKMGVFLNDFGGGLFGQRFAMPSSYAGSPTFQFGSISTTDGTTFSPYLTVFGNGNVGIGTANPENPLHVVGIGLIQNDAGGLAASLGMAQLQIRGRTTPAKNLWIGFDTSADVGVIQPGVVGVSWNHLLLNPVGGNVGIGTANPGASLHVNGGAIIGPGVASSAGTLHVSGSLFVKKPTAGDTEIVLQDGAPSNTGRIIQSATLLKITNNATPIELSANSNAGIYNQLVLAANGSVGIHTVQPYSRLSLGDNAPNVAQRIAFYEAQGTGQFFRGIGMANPQAGLWGVGIWAIGATGVLPTDANMSFIVLDNGNVGIGTVPEASFYRLQVAGGRTMFTPNSEPYAFGVRNGYGLPVCWMGADAAGTFMLCEAGGVARLSVSQAGAVGVPYMPTVNPGAGAKTLWADPADGYRVKWAA